MNTRQYAHLKFDDGLVNVNAAYIVWYKYDEKKDVTYVHLAPDGMTLKFPGDQIGEIIGATNETPFDSRIEHGSFKKAIEELRKEALSDG